MGLAKLTEFLAFGFLWNASQYPLVLVSLLSFFSLILASLGASFSFVSSLDLLEVS